MSEKQTLNDVKTYYGKVLQTNEDLKTNACCLAETMLAPLKEIVKEIHPEVLEKFYGCGSPIPPVLEGLTVLDLGCGTGRDCFMLSKLVGANGQVVGVDMTPEQLGVAERHRTYHAEKFGYKAPNTKFLHGYIEDLESLGIANNSVDLVVSNCVLNLSPDKRRVFSEIFRVLKPGGELYFSDVFADRRIPEDMAQDPILRGECLGGALYIEDFRRLLADLGCRDSRSVSQSPLQINNPEVAEKIGLIRFYSITVRAFKLKLEDRCEDYGQTATYRGTIPGSPHYFVLDDHHLFEAGRLTQVCRNTAMMLNETRYAPYFEIGGRADTPF